MTMTDIAVISAISNPPTKNHQINVKSATDNIETEKYFDSWFAFFCIAGLLASEFSIVLIISFVVL